MSKSDEKHLEFKVGIFVLIGLLVVGGLIVQFGRLGEGFQKTYRIQVVFPDASGLYKGAEVLMSGARIGRVAASPELLDDQTGVLVYLKLYAENQIPKSSTIRVGTNGLLGDKFVQVWPPPPEERGNEFIMPGDRIMGQREPGLDELTRDGREVMKEMKLATQNIRDVLLRVNRQLLNDQNTASIATTLQNIESSTRDLSTFTKKLDGWGNTAGKALEDFSDASKSASELLDGGNKLVDEARTGKGVLATLLNDQELANNLRALVENLKERGVLFYKDRAARDGEEAPPSRQSRRN
jgi:phospholipid/cholesterol/gamma-HCH transport system substrate-binding protein